MSPFCSLASPTYPNLPFYTRCTPENKPKGKTGNHTCLWSWRRKANHKLYKTDKSERSECSAYSPDHTVTHPTTPPEFIMYSQNGRLRSPQCSSLNLLPAVSALTGDQVQVDQKAGGKGIVLETLVLSPRSMETRQVPREAAAMKTHLSPRHAPLLAPRANITSPGRLPFFLAFLPPQLNASHISHLQNKTKPNQKGEIGEQDWLGRAQKTTKDSAQRHGQCTLAAL